MEEKVLGTAAGCMSLSSKSILVEWRFENNLKDVLNEGRGNLPFEFKASACTCYFHTGADAMHSDKSQDSHFTEGADQH